MNTLISCVENSYIAKHKNLFLFEALNIYDLVQTTGFRHFGLCSCDTVHMAQKCVNFHWHIIDIYRFTCLKKHKVRECVDLHL